jgi:hypothetical protein
MQTASGHGHAAVRRRRAHELYQQLAFTSFVIWTLGTLILFILLAAGNPRPIPGAGMAMMISLVVAAIPWLAYRPLVSYLTTRRIRLNQPSAANANDRPRLGAHHIRRTGAGGAATRQFPRAVRRRVHEQPRYRRPVGTSRRMY